MSRRTQRGPRGTCPRPCCGPPAGPPPRLDAVSWPTAALDLRLLAARIATGLRHLEVARTELRSAARARHSTQLERRARAWHALALLRAQAGDRRGAYAAVSAGLTAAERVRLLLGATELRVMVASHVSELAALGVSLAVTDAVADRVLWSAERHRAASLRMRPVFPPADESLAALRAQLRATAGEAERRQLAGLPAQALSRRQHALEDQLRQRLRHYRVVSRSARRGAITPSARQSAVPASQRAASCGHWPASSGTRSSWSTSSATASCTWSSSRAAARRGRRCGPAPQAFAARARPRRASAGGA